MPAKIYAIANRKGGCSKTTTCGALASGLKKRGYKVLAVDMDPQGDLTDWSGVYADDINTTFEVLGGKCTTREAIVELERYDLVPADATLSLAGDVISKDKKLKKEGRERLRNVLEEVRGDYDFIFLDTPPSLDLLTVSSLIAADAVIVPTDNGKFATKGLGELNELIASVREKANPDLRICGVLITKFSGRQNVAKVAAQMTKRFADFIDAPVYDSVIRFSGDIPLAIQDSVDLWSIPRKNVGVHDYASFVDEFLAKEGIVDEQVEN